MTAHPILFTGEMVRAILAGSKTQTRRIYKRRFMGEWINNPPGGLREKVLLTDCPYGVPGDLLWVRETWGAWPYAGGGVQLDSVRYRATDNPPEDLHNAWRWRPSIHMPRELSRLTLRIINVRVERVQDISESDALEEGIEQINEAPVPGHFDYRAREKFSGLWDSINEKRGYSWESNPWVWVIDWDKVWTQNVDEVAG